MNGLINSISQFPSLWHSLPGILVCPHTGVCNLLSLNKIFPNHSHYGLEWPLHQPISVQVVRHGPQFLHAKDLAHFVDDSAHKVSTPVTQEPGWGPKDQDLTLKQKLGDGFGCLIRGHICQYILCEVVLEHQDISDFRWLSSSKVVAMLVKSTCKRSRGAVATIGYEGALDKPPPCCKQCAQVLMDCHIWLVIPGHQPQQGQSAVMAPMSCIPKTSIQSSDPMCFWDYKKQKIFILTLGHRAQV